MALPLAACGGGGGGRYGRDAGSAAASTSAEYLRNCGTADSGAIATRNPRATGAGINIGVVDSSVDFADMAGCIFN